MKTQELLACLRAEERMAFEKTLRQHRRQSLTRLYKILVQAGQKGEEPDNEALFAAAFQKAYSKNQDYLLRNELRLLNREIELFLLEKEVLNRIRQEETREINPVIVWLELLLERRQTGLFEKEWRSLEKQARQTANYSLLNRLYVLYLEYVYRFQELHPELYRKVDAQLQEAYENVQLAAAEQFRILDVKRAYVHRLLQAFGMPPEIPFQETVLQAPAGIEDHLLLRYLRTWAQTYQAKDKIPLFRQLLEWQPVVVQLRPEMANNEFVFLNNLALLLMHEQKNYEQADHYFTQAMDNYRQRHKQVNTELCFNYLTNLTRLGRFEEVLQQYDLYRESLEADQKLRFKFSYLLAINHLLLGQTTSALSHIPEDMRQRPRFEYIYSRFLYAIAYYVDGLEEAFEREIQNLYQTILYKTPEESGEWNYTLGVFRKFARIRLKEPNTRASKQQLAELSQLLEQDLESQTPGADNLILFWLRRELKGKHGR